MSRPTQEAVDVALGRTALFVSTGMLDEDCHQAYLAAEVIALRNELAYERTLRNGLERMLKTLDTQLTAAGEVLP